MTAGGGARWLALLKPDVYILLILGAVVLATLLPARDEARPILDVAVSVGIGLVFFLHGARLSREAVIAGATQWRLHALVLASTFVLFPLLTLAAAALPAWILPASLAPGLIFLGCLPSTIQSSIGFTAIARGNVPATVAAATASNLIGIVLTPVLAGLLLHRTGGGVSLEGVQTIGLQLLAPFLAGHLLRPWIAGLLAGRAKALSRLDRGSILLVVYAAFSDAVTGGLWSRLGALDLMKLVVVCGVLLALVLCLTLAAARAARLSTPDEITLVFCGSKKSLASGVPMAGALFPGDALGLALLPIMVFHQIQLMVVAVIAERYAERPEIPAETRPGG
ncbi:bile acid:sodium symporter family protein [Phenylobacterium sp.]|uniref:bile acid:sodium symporter family protein n=1 Tax=Phenylobacterium sp. TaxID=1871053 RepID=UPI0025D7869A|nr:bile acid:sodium symporter family protein [Phenylobacterium sp.]